MVLAKHRKQDSWPRDPLTLAAALTHTWCRACGRGARGGAPRVSRTRHTCGRGGGGRVCTTRRTCGRGGGALGEPRPPVAT